MKTKIRNIIAIVLLVIALGLAVFDGIMLAEVIIDYIRLSNTEGSDGVDFLGVALGAVFTLIFSLPIPVLSGASLFIAKDKRLKITSAVLLIFGILTFFGGLLFGRLI